jgi:hypothetical protein
MLHRKPHKGDRVSFPPSKYSPKGTTGIVTRTPEGDDNICWFLPDGQKEPTCFIWRFPDGRNVLAELEGT